MIPHGRTLDQWIKKQIQERCVPPLKLTKSPLNDTNHFKGDPGFFLLNLDLPRASILEYIPIAKKNTLLALVLKVRTWPRKDKNCGKIQQKLPKSSSPRDNGRMVVWSYFSIFFPNFFCGSTLLCHGIGGKKQVQQFNTL